MMISQRCRRLAVFATIATLQCNVLVLGWTNSPVNRKLLNHPRQKRFQQTRCLLLHASKPGSNDNEKDNCRLPQAFDAAVFKKSIAAAVLACGILFFPVHGMVLAGDVPAGQRYWFIMESASSEASERVVANEALVDFAVGTINTMYYDNSGGAAFSAREFYERWRTLRNMARQDADTTLGNARSIIRQSDFPTDVQFDSREGAVKGVKWLVSSLNDPYSKYLTREELRRELEGGQNGFLGLGAIVETPTAEKTSTTISGSLQGVTTTSSSAKSNSKLLSLTRVANLPVVTAVAPDSPAERSGLVVGDRIVAVGEHNFLGFTRQEVRKTLETSYAASNYLGHAELTVAKPVFGMTNPSDESSSRSSSSSSISIISREVVLGYRQTRVRLPTTVTEPFSLHAKSLVSGGDSIVHYELLTSASGSIFDRSKKYDITDTRMTDNKVGYIRMTRFSRASTAGYLKAVQALEEAGAQSYILDLRNNYGGVIQEAMLTASTLLRDSHSILCYTLNSRGGFTGHDVEEYVFDSRYPGYLLSKESSRVTMKQVRRESPDAFENGAKYIPPSSYASLHEQHALSSMRTLRNLDRLEPTPQEQVRAQKEIVILINEGTASSAEVFCSALHDNGRLVALVGTKSYGKGLIQHTFPMPDGGGLRLTVAEYLTPSLRHVTNVGRARFDQQTGEFVGGGIRPDIVCESKQIPSNIGADLCVSTALDALEEADAGKLEEAVLDPTSELLARRIN
jgi:C-terminal processing protease CtpA/Prc